MVPLLNECRPNYLQHPTQTLPPRSVNALILAAGAGMRIKPLSAELPKGLMPILDIPPIHRHRARLQNAGVHQVWMNSHLHTPLLVAAARGLTNMGMPTRVSVEANMLGTAGAVLKLKEYLTDPFVVVNADIITDLDLAKLIRSHNESAALATLAAVRGPRNDLRIAQGAVSDLPTEDRDQPGTTYCGVAVFQPEVAQMITLESSGLYEQVFVPLVSRGQMAAHLSDAYWKDLGRASDYLTANIDALKRRASDDPSLRPTNGYQRWDSVAYVGNGASVEDCILESCVVGAGAQLEPGTALSRCVVWPNTHVRKGNHREAVITPLHTVQV